jgi:hypothetical protein
MKVRSRNLGSDQSLQKALRIRGAAQVVANSFMTQDPRNPSERANVRACRALRTEQEEEQRDRFRIECIEVYRIRRNTGGKNQRINFTGTSVRNRDPAPNPCTEQRLAIENGGHDPFARGGVSQRHGELNQLAQHLVLGSAGQRDFDALRSQEIGQHFSTVSGKNES